MSRIFILSIAVLASLSYTVAQPKATIEPDFVLSSKRIWLLTKNGEIAAAELHSKTPVATELTIDFKAVAITKNRTGNLVAADDQHRIRLYNESTQQWSELARLSDPINGLRFTSTNNGFALTNRGIIDIKTGRLYFPDSTLFLNDQIRAKTVWFDKPTCFMDKHDRLWIGFDYGEWGGDVFVFDTKKLKFLPLKINGFNMNMNPVHAFCEDRQSVYMSGGLSHMFLTHGSIIKFVDFTATPLLTSQDKPDTVTVEMPDRNNPKVMKNQRAISYLGGEQIGPMAYNPMENCLYYYSQTGLHRGNVNTDLSDLKNWPVVLSPKLQRDGSRHNAAGPTVGAIKMEFAPDGTLLLQTQYNGFGSYDGKVITFFVIE